MSLHALLHLLPIISLLVYRQTDRGTKIIRDLAIVPWLADGRAGGKCRSALLYLESADRNHKNRKVRGRKKVMAGEIISFCACHEGLEASALTSFLSHGYHIES